MTHFRTWYGIPADVSVQDGGWHEVRMGPLALPHPALINGFLRQGVPREIRTRMTCSHEVGHLQTLPVAVCHAAWLGSRLASAPDTRDRLASSAARCGTAFLVHAAAWELLAETCTWLENRRSYRMQSRWRRLVFWGSMVGVVLAGTLSLAAEKGAGRGYGSVPVSRA